MTTTALLTELRQRRRALFRSLVFWFVAASVTVALSVTFAARVWLSGAD